MFYPCFDGNSHFLSYCNLLFYVVNVGKTIKDKE